MKKFNENLIEACNTVLEMNRISERGAKECEDEGCSNLYSQMNADAEKLLKLLTEEVSSHVKDEKFI